MLSLGMAVSQKGAARSLQLIYICFAGTALAQSVTRNAATAECEENHLADEVEDPTAILTQLQLQNLYTPRNFQTSAQTNTIQFRPVVPINPLLGFPLQQLIRPTFKVQSIATTSRSSTATEFTDMELFDLVVANWPDARETGFAWGVGPTFVFPTGRVPTAGNHAWQAGPAVGAVFRGIPHLTLGFLFQNPVSFAYANSSAMPQSQMQFTVHVESDDLTYDPRPRVYEILGWN